MAATPYLGLLFLYLQTKKRKEKSFLTLIKIWEITLFYKTDSIFRSELFAVVTSHF